MPGYITDALQKFQHPDPTRLKHFSHQCTPHSYGSKTPQMYHQTDDSPDLATYDASTFQQVVVTLLYYVCAVEPTILVVLNSIATKQANSTQATKNKMVQLINYSATHPEDITLYHASGMTLHMQSYVSFFSTPRAKSIVGGYHNLSTIGENYWVITLILEKYGNLPLCLENYALFSLPPIFTTILYTYPLRYIIYLGKPSGNIISNYHGTSIHIFMHGYYHICTQEKSNSFFLSMLKFYLPL